jgi:hypothetical protein
LTLHLNSAQVTPAYYGLAVWANSVTATVNGYAKSMKISIEKIPGAPFPPNIGIYSTSDKTAITLRRGGRTVFSDARLSLGFVATGDYLVTITAVVNFGKYQCYYGQGVVETYGPAHKPMLRHATGSN